MRAPMQQARRTPAETAAARALIAPLLAGGLAVLLAVAVAVPLAAPAKAHGGPEQVGVLIEDRPVRPAGAG